MNVRFLTLGATCDAGRAIVDRVIIGDVVALAADVTVVANVSAVAPIKRNIRLVFIAN